MFPLNDTGGVFDFMCNRQVSAFFFGVGAVVTSIGMHLQASTNLLFRVVLGSESYLAIFWLYLCPYCRSIWDFPGVFIREHVVMIATILKYIARGFRPAFPEWTMIFDVIQALVMTKIFNYGETMVRLPNARVLRLQTALLGTCLGLPACWWHGTRLETFQSLGLEHIWVRSNQPRSSRTQRYVIVFFHGSAYTVLCPRLYIAASNRLRHHVMKALRRRLGDDAEIDVDVFLANYRKSPEHKYPIPQMDVLQMYDHVCKTEGVPPPRILVAGDSAGGGLVLSTLMRLRQRKDVMPAGGILSYALVDLDHQEPAILRCSIDALRPEDQENADWPEDVTPLKQDLHGLPPIFIQVGTEDIIMDDSVRLYEKSQREGMTDWKLDICSNMIHGFTVVPTFLLPAVEDSVVNMAAFAAERLQKSQPDIGCTAHAA